MLKCNSLSYVGLMVGVPEPSVDIGTLKIFPAPPNCILVSDSLILDRYDYVTNKNIVFIKHQALTFFLQVPDPAKRKQKVIHVFERNSKRNIY